MEDQMTNEQMKMQAFQNIIVKMEYIWFDGYNICSKTKYENWVLNLNEGLSREDVLSRCPLWEYTENDSISVILSPVKIYQNPLEASEMPSFIVLCERMDASSIANVPYRKIGERDRRSIQDEVTEDFHIGFGFECNFIDRSTNKPLHSDNIKTKLNVSKDSYRVGASHAGGRSIVDTFAAACHTLRIPLIETHPTGNSSSSWFIGTDLSPAVEAIDDFLVMRYLINKMTEDLNVFVDMYSAMRFSFSTKEMREEGGEDLFSDIRDTFDKKRPYHKLDVPVFVRRNHFKGHMNDYRFTATDNPYDIVMDVAKALSDDSGTKETEEPVAQAQNHE